MEPVSSRHRLGPAMVSPKMAELSMQEADLLCHHAQRRLPPLFIPVSPLKVKSGPWAVVTIKQNLRPRGFATGGTQPICSGRQTELTAHSLTVHFSKFDVNLRH